MEPTRPVPADIRALIGRTVISRHAPEGAVYDGELPRGYGARLTHDRGAPVLACPAREAAPADEARRRTRTDPVTRARVGAYHRGPDTPPRARWVALVDGEPTGDVHRTKRDATDYGITVLAVAEWWAARDATVSTVDGAA